MPKLANRFLFLSLLTLAFHAATALAQYRIAYGSGPLAVVLLYYAAVAGLLASYAAVVGEVHEAPPTPMRWLIVGVPLVVQIGWMLTLPTLAIDAYSYLVDAAHTSAGLSPYAHPVGEAAGTPLGDALSSYHWRPVHGVTPYGPLWLDLVSVVGPFVPQIGVAVRLVKLIAFAATALTAWLVFRLAPDSHRVRVFTIFWWNPVVIIEGAGEGHNDAVMVLLVVLSLWCLRRRAVVTASVALTAAVLTKWIPALFAPAYLVYAARHRLLTRRQVVAGAIAIGVVGIAAYVPVWSGAESFAGIRRLGGTRFIASTTGSMARILGGHPLVYAALRAAVAAALAIVTITAASTTRSTATLIAACGATIIAYLLVAAPMFWAWYVLLPIALLALSNGFLPVMVLTATSRLVAPLDALLVRRALSHASEVWLTTIVALWLPLLYFVWHTRTSWLATIRPARRLVDGGVTWLSARLAERRASVP